MQFHTDIHARRSFARGSIALLSNPICTRKLEGVVGLLDECQYLLREVKRADVERHMRVLGAKEDAIKEVMAQVRATLSAVDEIAATIEESCFDPHR